MINIVESSQRGYIMHTSILVWRWLVISFLPVPTKKENSPIKMRAVHHLFKQLELLSLLF